MNNPIMALAQMATNRISSDPSFQKNPQARAFMDIMQRGDIAQGQQMAKNLPEMDRRWDPDEYDVYARMGYFGRHATTSEMGRNWDKYLDARRHYNATKSDADRMEMSTSAKMHIGETIATLRDMWHDADPDLREKMKKDFSALLQEMN